jgi:hypothetical protein
MSDKYDLAHLRTLSREALLELCLYDHRVSQLCNTDPILLQKLIMPPPPVLPTRKKV